MVRGLASGRCSAGRAQVVHELLILVLSRQSNVAAKLCLCGGTDALQICRHIAVLSEALNKRELPTAT